MEKWSWLVRDAQPWRGGGVVGEFSAANLSAGPDKGRLAGGEMLQGTDTDHL